MDSNDDTSHQDTIYTHTYNSPARPPSPPNHDALRHASLEHILNSKQTDFLFHSLLGANDSPRQSAPSLAVGDMNTDASLPLPPRQVIETNRNKDKSSRVPSNAERRRSGASPSRQRLTAEEAGKIRKLARVGSLPLAPPKSKDEDVNRNIWRRQARDGIVFQPLRTPPRVQSPSGDDLPTIYEHTFPRPSLQAPGETNFFEPLLESPPPPSPLPTSQSPPPLDLPPILQIRRPLRPNLEPKQELTLNPEAKQKVGTETWPKIVCAEARPETVYTVTRLYIPPPSTQEPANMLFIQKRFPSLFNAPSILLPALIASTFLPVPHTSTCVHLDKKQNWNDSGLHSDPDSDSDSDSKLDLDFYSKTRANMNSRSKTVIDQSQKLEGSANSSVDLEMKACANQDWQAAGSPKLTSDLDSRKNTHQTKPGNETRTGSEVHFETLAVFTTLESANAFLQDSSLCDINTGNGDETAMEEGFLHKRCTLQDGGIIEVKVERVAVTSASSCPTTRIAASTAIPKPSSLPTMPYLALLDGPDPTLEDNPVKATIKVKPADQEANSHSKSEPLSQSQPQTHFQIPSPNEMEIQGKEFTITPHAKRVDDNSKEAVLLSVIGGWAISSKSWNLEREKEREREHEPGRK